MQQQQNLTQCHLSKLWLHHSVSYLNIVYLGYFKFSEELPCTLDSA